MDGNHCQIILLIQHSITDSELLIHSLLNQGSLIQSLLIQRQMLGISESMDQFFTTQSS